MNSTEKNRCLHISQLSPDYLSPAGNFVRVLYFNANFFMAAFCE